jgi:hypothetical protein
VARIGEEGKGIAQKAKNRLGDDEGEIEDKTDFEGAIDFQVVVVGIIMGIGGDDAILARLATMEIEFRQAQLPRRAEPCCVGVRLRVAALTPRSWGLLG